MTVFRSLLLFALNLVCGAALLAQGTQVSERAAKEAVYRIVRHSGLQPNFVVHENAEVPTAIAFIKGRNRVIEYNPGFIASIVDSSRTDWSAVSILAHEIAHHLLGHTLDPAEVHPGDELACDHYSGFILHGMGASLKESLAAMEVAGNAHGTRSHPPKYARLAAIEQGWEDAECIADKVEQQAVELKEDFKFVVHFAGDDNTYYVDSSNAVVWFNNYAQPIRFGTCSPSGSREFVYMLTWEDQTYYVDAHNAIWRRTEHQMLMNVGRLEPFARQ